MYIHQFGTVDELKYLKMSGRISASKALFGTLLSVKPVIISNKEGENVSVAKAKGRIKAIRALADGVKENYTGSVIPEIFITHADCPEDADRLKDYITEDLPGCKIHTGFLNPIVGASCGPKMLAVYFSGGEKPDTADM